jgi:hypothetical protein
MFNKIKKEDFFKHHCRVYPASDYIDVYNGIMERRFSENKKEFSGIIHA